MDNIENRFGIVDEDALRDAKRVHVADVVALLFPGHPVSRRGVFRSPFREDRKPSFSPYRGHGGDWMWKDHATGECGDNLALYRKVFPDLSYQQAVDGLCRLVLGRPGLKEGAVAVPGRPARRAERTSPVRERSGERPAQTVVWSCPLDDSRVPEGFRRYWRNRGISDEVIARHCEYVCFENANRKGQPLMDRRTQLPLLDADGNPLVDDGLRYAIGMRNDLGGYSLRVPDLPGAEGYKTNTSSFITTFLADGSRPRRLVNLCGEGDGFVHFLRLDGGDGRIWINAGQYFSGMACHPAFSMSFLGDFVGMGLAPREVAAVCSVLDALSAPVSARGAVVEGMFDGLSERELGRLRLGFALGRDLVVLNSVGNSRWAAPFLARHDQVTMLLDNDLRSGAGQKAYVSLSGEIARFNERFGTHTSIFNGASMFAGYKDLNDALRAAKGFPDGKGLGVPGGKTPSL